MRNMQATWWILLAGAFCLLAACEGESTRPAVAPATPDTDQVTVLPPSDALRQDAEQYAADMGVDLEEALRRLQVQDDLGALHAALAANEPDTFAGFWIQHQPEYRIVVQFTRDGERIIHPYIEDKPWADLVDVRTVDATLTELESALAETARLLSRLDFGVTHALDEKENRVEIFVTDARWFKAELQKASIQLPEHVVLVTVEGQSAKEVDICAPSPLPGVAFPRQEPVEGIRVSMAAELIGDLVLVDGCVRVNSLYGDGSLLPVWPPEFTLKAENDEIQVLDGDAQVVARVGQEVYMGGGIGQDASLADCVRQQLPAGCTGPYWIVGDGVRPNLRRDSDLFSLDVITTTERSLLLLHKKPVLDALAESDGSLAGELVLYAPGRCPRVQSEDGLGDYLPLWPPDYAAVIEGDEVDIRDGTGQVVVRVGEDVQLGGGAITVDWESEPYRRLHSELSGDCIGPYWIVKD
jgi:hypothetical protein